MEIEDKPKFNEMQTVKRRMFAMRNGVIADTLRKAGSPFSIIFGLNLPQLVEIANEMGKNRDLAQRLWENTTTRESMLIAPMLMPVDEFSEDDAIAWIEDVNTVEVADILCHRLLRHEPYALDLVRTLVKSDDVMKHYTGLRLMCNLAGRCPEEAHRIGEDELRLSNPKTYMLALQLTQY